MARSLVADTNAIVRYFLDNDKLSPRAASALEDAFTAGEPLFVATISIVELIYLIERKRLPPLSLQRLLEEANNPESSLSFAPLDAKIALALERIPRDQVPDMPDRIITATALAFDLPLVSSDSMIRANTVVEVIW